MQVFIARPPSHTFLFSNHKCFGSLPHAIYFSFCLSSLPWKLLCSSNFTECILKLKNYYLIFKIFFCPLSFFLEYWNISLFFSSSLSSIEAASNLLRRLPYWLLIGISFDVFSGLILIIEWGNGFLLKTSRCVLSCNFVWMPCLYFCLPTLPLVSVQKF